MRRAEEHDLLPSAAFTRGVLSLDLSSAVGWAFAPPVIVPLWPSSRPYTGVALVAPDPRPDDVRFGTWDLERTASHGARFAALRTKLTSYAAPGFVVIEQAIPSKFSRNNAATQIAEGLRAVVHGWAASINVTVTEVPIISAKAWFGSPMTKDKTPMIACARSLGWAVTDDHQADALAILDLTLARAAAARRLFGRKAA